ncbi:MAG: carboxymuconolactone decarboxylase family protein [Lysobacterales bacterium]
MTDLTQRLDRIRQQRGYLLPHHGLMATAMPEVLDAYDALYRQLAFSHGGLSEHDHELIWLAILAAKHEGIATHHVTRFLAAGGTRDEIVGVLGVSAAAAGCPTWQFADQAWAAHVEGLDAEVAFCAAIERAGNGLSAAAIHLSAISALVCCGNFKGLRWQLRAAYRGQVDEHAIAHALALTMFPGSVPGFVQAAEVWQSLIVAGEVEATQPFRIWARSAGQGGHNATSESAID